MLLVIFILSVLHSSGSSLSSPQDSNPDDDFYHAFDTPDNGEGIKAILGGAGRKPTFKSGSRRTLNTSEGVVYIKDVLFQPKRPLPKGVNVYQLDKLNKDQLSVDEDRASQLLNSKRPKNQQELSEFLSNLKFARDSKEVERKIRDIMPSMESIPVAKKEEPSPPNPQIERQQDEELVNGMCTRAPCNDYLTPLDSPHFKYCRKKARIKSDHEPSATLCRFRQSTPDTPLVALASPLGSGSGTLRWLLQEVTGLCTGSTYCNVNLRRAGYAGECLRSTTVLVVASDQTDPFWSGIVPSSLKVPKGFSKIIDVPVFDKAVYLLRNPFDVILEAWSLLRDINAKEHSGK